MSFYGDNKCVQWWKIVDATNKKWIMKQSQRRTL